MFQKAFSAELAWGSSLKPIVTAGSAFALVVRHRQELAMSTQLRWIAAAVAVLAVGQVSAQGYYANPNYVPGNGYGNGYFVRCESYSYRSTFCRVNAPGRIFVARQLSDQRCIRGRNWNADFRGIWVADGCRADFAIVPARGNRQGGGYAAQYNGPAGYPGNGYPVNQGGNPNAGYNNGPRDAYRTDANRDAGYNDPRYGNGGPPYANYDPRYGNNVPPQGNNDPRYGNNGPPYANNDPRYGNNDPRDGNNDPRNGNNDSRNGNNDPRATNNPRDEDRAGDQETCATPPDANGYCNPPQH
jgi:hypothetical protein